MFQQEGNKPCIFKQVPNHILNVFVFSLEYIDEYFEDLLNDKIAVGIVFNDIKHIDENVFLDDHLVNVV
jgi:hypothetical protein